MVDSIGTKQTVFAVDNESYARRNTRETFVDPVRSGFEGLQDRTGFAGWDVYRESMAAAIPRYLGSIPHSSSAIRLTIWTRG